MRLLVFVLLCIWAIPGHTEPMGQAKLGEKVTVVLHSEKCALDAVANLPGRATWVEDGKTFEGCFGFDRNFGIIRLYFSDKTVVAVPVQLFARVYAS